MRRKPTLTCRVNAWLFYDLCDGERSSIHSNGVIRRIDPKFKWIEFETSNREVRRVNVVRAGRAEILRRIAVWMGVAYTAFAFSESSAVAEISYGPGDEPKAWDSCSLTVTMLRPKQAGRADYFVGVSDGSSASDVAMLVETIKHQVQSEESSHATA